MKKEAQIWGALILKLYQGGKTGLIDRVIVKLKQEGKKYLLSEILDFIEEKSKEQIGLLAGQLELAFEEADIPNLIEQQLQKKLKCPVIIQRQKVNPDLILGGRFRTKEVELDFSLKNLLRSLSL